ncbi:MAG: general secretion pathway protein C [Hydrogenophaga sp.]|jgi:general secretion pathway protein C|nr:general secretion pathway protein C [Hydrogenophaga sp.]
MSKSMSFGHSIFPGDVPAGLVAAQRPWSVVAAGVLWLAAGLSAGYWALQFWGSSPVTPVAAASGNLPVVDSRSVALALGVADVQPSPVEPVAQSVVPTRYSLLGVVADRREQGAALIAVDGQPPKPYAVGAELEGGLFLQAVGERLVRLGPSMEAPHTVELTLPLPPEGL